MPNSEPASIPKNDPIPFAPVPTGTCFWPVRTGDARKRVVSFLRIDGEIVGSQDRRFLAMRADKTRYHVAVDLYGIPGDAVVACRDGVVVSFKSFYKDSNSLLVEHGDVVVNYSEVAQDSLSSNNLVVGSQVKAGQRIGTVAQLDENGMCHFETYSTGTKHTSSWMVDEGRPPNLLNPTKLLLRLAENGVGIDVAEAATKNRAFEQSEEWQTRLRELAHVLKMSTPPCGSDDPALALAIAGWQLANHFPEDGLVGPGLWDSLKRAATG